MTVAEIKVIAKEMGIPVSGKRKEELIHEIQLQEGNAPCYKSGIEDCGLINCLWIDDCQRK